jgi:hypothetical protein
MIIADCTICSSYHEATEQPSIITSVSIYILVGENQQPCCLQVALEDPIHIDVHHAASKEVRDDDHSITVLHIHNNGLLPLPHGDLHRFLLAALHIYVHRGCACLDSHMIPICYHIHWDHGTVDHCHSSLRARP